MTEKDFNKMIALIEANNWSIRSMQTQPAFKGMGVSFDALVVLAETYNSVVMTLKQGGIEVPSSLNEINCKDFEDSPTKLMQVIYNKDCLIHPLLKLELSELRKNGNKQNFQQRNDNINFDEVRKRAQQDAERIRTEVQKAINESKEYVKAFQEEMSKVKDAFSNTTNTSCVDDIEETIDDLQDEIDDLQDEIDDLQDDVSDLEEELKENTGDYDDLSSQIKEKYSEIFELQDKLKELTEKLKNLK